MIKSLDEAIKHCEEVAERLEKQVKPYKCESINKKLYEVNKKEFDNLLECARDHRQLAEWLRELREHEIILNELSDEIKRAFDDLIESENYGEDDSCTEYNRGCVWGLLHAYEMFGRKYEEVKADEDSD